MRGRHERGGSRPGDWLVPWGLAVLLLAPSAWWVATDRSVWSWDPSFYAMDTVDLWFRLASEPARWPGRMTTVFQAKAPGIAWLGQFFVPIGQRIGSVETGLLASILLVQLGTLVLTFRIGRRIAPASILPAAVGTLLVAASPLFVAMSHHFLTEALQLLSVTYLVWVAAASASMTPAQVLLHLVIAGSVGLVAKFSTPAYVVFPALLVAARTLASLRRPETRLGFGARELRLTILAAGALTLALAWYAHNGKHTYAFAKLAASSDVALHYGSQGTLAAKLAYWAGAAGRHLLGPWASLLLAVGALAAGWVVAQRLRAREPVAAAGADGKLALAALLQVVFVLLLMARTINEETRYVLPLAPMIAVLAVWLLAVSRFRRGAVAALLVLAAQWASVHAKQLGAVENPSATYWEKPPAKDSARMRDVSAAVRKTCEERTAGKWSMTGVDLDWLNHWTLRFYANKTLLLERGLICYYEYLGFAPKDPEAALRRLAEYKVPYFISLEESAMPQPPDFLNQVAMDVFRRVRQDPRFVREQLASPSGIAVFKHVGRWEGEP